MKNLFKISKNSITALLSLTFVLLTLTALILAGCADMGEPANTGDPASTTTAVTTIDRDELTLSNLSEQQKKLYHSAWEALKDRLPEDCTINNLVFGSLIMEYDEAIVCYYRGALSDKSSITEGCGTTQQTVAGYEFCYSSSLQMAVFANGKKYNLKSAYEAGVLSEDEIRTIWEDHKARNENLYTYTEE